MASTSGYQPNVHRMFISIVYKALGRLGIKCIEVLRDANMKCLVKMEYIVL